MAKCIDLCISCQQSAFTSGSRTLTIDAFGRNVFRCCHFCLRYDISPVRYFLSHPCRSPPMQRPLNVQWWFHSTRHSNFLSIAILSVLSIACVIFLDSFALMCFLRALICSFSWSYCHNRVLDDDLAPSFSYLFIEDDYEHINCATFRSARHLFTNCLLSFPLRSWVSCWPTGTTT